MISDLAANADPARQKALFHKYYEMGRQQRNSYLAAEKLLHQVVELNAGEVESVTQDAEKSTKLAQKMTHSAQRIDELASKLSDAVRIFKI